MAEENEFDAYFSDTAPAVTENTRKSEVVPENSSENAANVVSGDVSDV
jgi:hypothetical protein